MAPLSFRSAFTHFGTHFEESFRVSKPSRMMDPNRLRGMPSYSAIYLAEIVRSSNISSWIWWIISGMVTVLIRPGRGATQVEKSLSLNWATQFLTVAYDGACSPEVSFRKAWIFFGALPCRKERKKNLMTARVSMLLKSRASLACFLSASVTRKTCNSAHEQTPLSNDTIDSVLRHWEVGRAKDLSAPPRTAKIQSWKPTKQK